MNEPRLSVIVICKNEADHIRGCLDSVSWANEIIVLDSGSTDGTVEICREYTEHVFETDWPGYGRQKNRALAHATGDWVLSIDADERVPPELFGEIFQAIHAPGEHVAFRMPRLSSYCGRWIRRSGWSPDYVTRLFRRDAARFTDDIVHERVEASGAVGTLETPLEHRTFESLEDVLHKVDEYSTAGAKQHLARGKSGSVTKAVLRGLFTFFKTYVLRAGFLDGREGFLLAVSNAEGVYYRYLKLMYLAEGRTADLFTPAATIGGTGDEPQVPPRPPVLELASRNEVPVSAVESRSEVGS